MKSLVLAWVALLALAAVLPATEEPWLAYSATNVAPAPAIDGQLTDPCWQAIESTAPFVCIGGAAAPTLTTGKVCWDDRNLYIAFVCAEPALAAIRQRMADRTLPPYEESVEMFFNPSHDHFTYMQLRVDILGNRDSRPDGDALDPAMNQRWSAAVALDEDRWTVEARIPLRLLAARPPDAGTVWGFNLNRSSASGCTCWSDTQGPFHSPSRFGHIIFVPPQVYLHSHFDASFQSIWDEVNALCHRDPALTAPYGRQVAALKAENAQFLNALEAAARDRDCAARYREGLDQERKLEALRSEVYLGVLRTMANTQRAP